MVRTKGSKNADLDTKVRVVVQALAVGDDVAAEQSGYARRTVSAWRADPKVLQAIPQEAHDAFVARLKGVFDLALARVEAGLSDDKSRLLDRTRALEAVGNAYRLATGAATTRREARVDVNVRGVIAQIAAADGLDEAELFAEYERISAALASGDAAPLLQELRPLAPVGGRAKVRALIGEAIAAKEAAAVTSEEHDAGMRRLLGEG